VGSGEIPRRSPALPTLSASAQDRVRLSTGEGRGGRPELVCHQKPILVPYNYVEHDSKKARALRYPREIQRPASLAIALRSLLRTKPFSSRREIVR
jgi:hypothetical protein